MTVYLQDPDVTLHHGDALDVLRQLPDGSVDCCVTSPPYWGLRDYGTGSWEGGDPSCDHSAIRRGHGEDEKQATSLGTSRDPIRGGDCRRCGARRVDRQLGLEATPDEYVARLVEVFREVRRVLSPTGTCWVNLGDSYTSGGRADYGPSKPDKNIVLHNAARAPQPPGLKPKDLCGIPWMVAFALRADSWYLRSEIIWSKPNPMPESVTDRPTKAHEQVFLLSRSPRYFFDQEAVRESGRDWGPRDRSQAKYNGDAFRAAGQQPHSGLTDGDASAGRNVRSVWEIATQPYPDAHFATFPEELARRCILAGCPEWACRTCGKPRERIVDVESSWRSRAENGAVRGNLAPEGLVGAGTQRAVHGAGVSHDLDSRRREVVGWTDCGHDAYRSGVVLDPFLGSGTTAHVARKHGRHTVGIELNEDYCKLAARRLAQQSLLTEGIA